MAALQHVRFTSTTCTASSGGFLNGERGRKDFRLSNSFAFPPAASSPILETAWSENTHARELFQVNSSRNGSVRGSVAEPCLVETTELDETREVGEEFVIDEDHSMSVTSALSCPIPNFLTSESSVSVYNPFGDSSSQADEDARPLLLYVAGMDCTGQGIRSQLPHLSEAGYDIRCLYIPSSDRSSWQQLVQLVLPMVKKEVEGVNGSSRHLTILGESFGGGLAMRLARAAPSLVSRLVVINPATNFAHSNRVASLAAQTGLLSLFTEPLYAFAQDILLPFLVKRKRVSAVGTPAFFSPVDYVPAACAAWRLSMLNDNSGLGDEDLKSIITPTLVVVSGKDRIVSSIKEGARLQSLLPNSKRVFLPESGHTALLEDAMNVAGIFDANGFTHPFGSKSSLPLSSNGQSPNPLVKRDEAVTDDVMDEMGLILEPWRFLTSPVITGAENLPLPSMTPRRPLLFVGNHTMFGIYDSPVLFYELYLRGFRCRGLAHPGHWVTGVGGLFERYGNVKATKLAAYKLLKDGENVLLFPGGAREVCKRKGEEYKLFWKETADFVRMASRHRAIIVPFGALGGDEAYDLLYDLNELKVTPLWNLVEEAYKRAGLDPEFAYPITAIPGTKIPSPFPIPRIERIYFHFAEAVDTAEYTIDMNDREQAQALYEVVKERVEDSIEVLKDSRSKDPERDLPARLMAKLGRMLPSFLPRMTPRRS